ncbi:hypothetical protein GNI_061130 [Gregarina niphandrodes]|uniref:Uncharacterized protein n=1 Tax=Gregarina niphandrodes TaxID=110365 RepID=A0A023B8C9_GRENI|nr:hypothetical protein GNI_061130 [Gregarina niphandrodes]EZG68845.1 hypothetical protein GNI_061130 [Gregarina niphandrodes]|eukprot:XP_011134539.1 hypothetical protein GNI_061130 [Gregarina niphandrodes]
MKCSRGVEVLSGGTNHALARVMLTMDVSGRQVDMVKTFESLALPADAAKSSNDHPAKLVVDACRILKDMPDLIIGLKNVKNVRYIDLSAEELREIHDEFNAKTDFCWNVLICLHGCMHAFAQVAKRKTCKLKGELKDRLSDWMERVATAYNGEPELDTVTNAARIEDLKFGLAAVVRCAVNNGDRTCGVAWYRPEVRPDPTDWQQAEIALGKVRAVRRLTAARRLSLGVWEAGHVVRTYEEMRTADRH